MAAHVMSQRVEYRGSPIDHAVAKKLTQGHLTQILEFQSAKEQHRHKEAREHTQYRALQLFGVVFAVLGFVLAAAWLGLAYGKPEMIQPLVVPVLSFLAGACAGFGGAKALGKSGDSKAD